MLFRTTDWLRNHQREVHQSSQLIGMNCEKLLDLKKMMNISMHTHKKLQIKL